MSSRRLHIETLGCQMNVLDSELVVSSLRRQGYVMAEGRSDADVVLFNTCSIREHAEEKVYSALGTMRAWKAEHPGAILGVIGCMAQKDQAGVLARAPFVDLVCGPGHVGDVPELIEQIRATRTSIARFALDGAPPRTPVVALSLERKEAPRREVEASFASWDPNRDPESRPNHYQAFVRTQFGCDKFCTYCIVPSVRGPEQGRDPDEIVAESEVLAGQGVKEITLLGQTVNSYRHRSGDGRITRLSDVLYRLSKIDGVERIKFVTNFPNDMTDDLLDAMREIEKVAPFLHVPAQSGCDEVLARMKRHYSVASYKEMLARARERVPGVTITSDFIVGFCGETEESFERSCDLVRDAKFKNSFIYAYSTRPGTRAHADLPDDVPEEVKKRRNNDLLAVQLEVSRIDHRAQIGKTVRILVEGPSKVARRTPEGVAGEILQLTGRAGTDHIVVFDGPRSLIGEMLDVTIEDAGALTLFGSPMFREGAGMPASVPSPLRVRAPLQPRLPVVP